MISERREASESARREVRGWEGVRMNPLSIVLTRVYQEKTISRMLVGAISFPSFLLFEKQCNARKGFDLAVKARVNNNLISL